MVWSDTKIARQTEERKLWKDYYRRRSALILLLFQRGFGKEVFSLKPDDYIYDDRPDEDKYLEFVLEDGTTQEFFVEETLNINFQTYLILTSYEPIEEDPDDYDEDEEPDPPDYRLVFHIVRKVTDEKTGLLKYVPVILPEEQALVKKIYNSFSDRKYTLE